MEYEIFLRAYLEKVFAFCPYSYNGPQYSYRFETILEI